MSERKIITKDKKSHLWGDLEGLLESGNKKSGGGVEV
jgi:hypothetical protein